MFAVVAAAFRYALGWIVSGTVVKFVVFAGLSYVIAAVVAVIADKVDFEGMSGIGGLLSDLPNDFLFYIGLFRLDLGIPMIIAAYVVRFGIRRLPIVG
jgi:hypothetical protein